MQDSFVAYVVEEGADGPRGAIREARLAELPAGDVLVRVAYSSLNYKDGLALAGKGKILRRFPIAPGIDLAGVVEESRSEAFQPGDAVLATGCGIGEQHWGGYSQYTRLPAAWVIPMPARMDARMAMAIGTAGFTAMLCVEALEHHGVLPEKGPVLVTGASGGVGCVAVLLLARLGYTVVAVSGKPGFAETLRAFGASEVLPREAMAAPPKPLESARWAGAVDTVGGVPLARALAETQTYGCVAACGNAAGAELHHTVLPFILRGVTLAGISSVNQEKDARTRVWPRLAEILPAELLESVTEEVALQDIEGYGARILRGEIQGRTRVRIP